MTKFSLLKWLMLAVVALSFLNCSKVPAGNVGVKFYLLGGDKGVDQEVLKPGRYWIGWNEDLFLFPTFTQNYVWTASVDEGSETNESFDFQDVQGLQLNADIGITYKIVPDKVPVIFEKYKRGVEEVTDVYLRNMVRDALVSRTSKLDVEYIYGKGKTALLDSVLSDVQKSCSVIGIDIEKLYWIGAIRLPKPIMDAIDLKIKATQIAQQRENELRETEAASKKQVVEAEGKAQSILVEAEAQAKANILLSRSITAELVQYKTVEKWNGVTPTVTGGNTPFINIK
jgi:regulator of protease activity HflC (stomatin/prohibitin superfamily)